jgi:hypothetical protein
MVVRSGTARRLLLFKLSYIVLSRPGEGGSGEGTGDSAMSGSVAGASAITRMVWLDSTEFRGEA